METDRDLEALRGLPYRRGQLGDAELATFARMRGPLTPLEQDELRRVARTLRRPAKRLKALDLLRHWGVPLSPEQRVMLPWFAGLAWHRPLPPAHETPSDAKDLARHLLCREPVPDFLFEPFVDPIGAVHSTDPWQVSRVLSVVGSGGGLDELRALDTFWTSVEPAVFERLLATPAGVPFARGLIDAFVRHWAGPDGLGELLLRIKPVRLLYSDIYPHLRFAQDHCRELRQQVPPGEPEELAERRSRPCEEKLLQRPSYSGCWNCVGETRALAIPNTMPVELKGWRAHELRTPSDFEEEDSLTARSTRVYFRDAQRGEVSIWSLRCEGRPRLTVRVDIGLRRIPRRRASLNYGLERAPSEDEGAVMRQWAEANGLSFEGA